jgi:hypothetical protein
MITNHLPIIILLFILFLYAIKKKNLYIIFIFHLMAIFSVSALIIYSQFIFFESFSNSHSL